MRFNKGGFTLLATLLAFGATLVFVDVVMAGFGCGLGGVLNSVRALEAEWELSDELEAKFHVVLENAVRKRQVLHDLIERRCDLRQAMNRYLGLCSSADLLSLRAAYRHHLDSTNPVIAQHLITLVERELQRSDRAECRLNQLQQEWTRLRSEPPHHDASAVLPGV